MKTKFMFPVIVAAALIAGLGGTLAADSTDEQQIRKIEQEWLDAIVHRDAAYLRKIEAADFVMIGPDGKMLSKDEDIKNTTGGDTIFDEIKLDDLKVRFYGDAAVANGSARIKCRSKDEDMSGKYCWTDVFVKTNGDWKAVSAQVTAVAQEKK